MKHSLYILIFFICIQDKISAMYTTFYKPTYWPEKPRFDRNNLTSVELTYSYNWAKNSFNKNGEIAPMLSFNNPEPLLPSFIDPTIKDCKKNKPIGYAVFDAEYISKIVHNEATQNINENLFLQFNVPIANSYLKNINITPSDCYGKAVNPTNELCNYIEKLKPLLFESSCKNEQSGSYIGPSFVFIGYTKSFNSFVRLDLLDLTIKTGLVIPAVALEAPSMPLYPRTEEPVNFGIPIQIQLMIGAYDWLNFGISTAIVPYITSERIVELNQCPYPNKLIIPTTFMTRIKHLPFITFTTYLEGEHFLPCWTWYIGFSFVKKYEAKWIPITNDPQDIYIANKYPVGLPWQQGSISISSEFNFTRKEKQCLPRLKFIFVKRLFGKNCLDAKLVAGQYGLEFIWDF